MRNELKKAYLLPAIAMEPAMLCFELSDGTNVNTALPTNLPMLAKSLNTLASLIAKKAGEQTP